MHGNEALRDNQYAEIDWHNDVVSAGKEAEDFVLTYGDDEARRAQVEAATAAAKLRAEARIMTEKLERERVTAAYPEDHDALAFFQAQKHMKATANLDRTSNLRKQKLKRKN